MYFVSQDTQTYCGVASSTMVLNALVPKEDRPTTLAWCPYHLFAQSNFFTKEVKKIAPRKQVAKSGMTLQQLGDVLKTFPVHVDVTHASDTTNVAFRTELIDALKSSDRCVIVNFLRTGVGQVGGGHFSPIAAFHKDSDSFLVYDVARYKYPPAWVKSTDVWHAVNTIDSDSQMTRGYLLVEKIAK